MEYKKRHFRPDFFRGLLSKRSVALSLILESDRFRADDTIGANLQSSWRVVTDQGTDRVANEPICFKDVLQGIESLSKSRKWNAEFDPSDLESYDAADRQDQEPGDAESRRKSDRRERNRTQGEHGEIDFADLEHEISPMKKFDRKTLQLCGQVARALAGCFADCPDPVINQLTVFAVTPKAGTAALEVAVCPAIPGVELDPHDVLPRLRENQGRLQDDVSHAITRKYAPRLTFRMANPDEVAAMQQPAASVDPDLLKLAIPTEEDPELDWGTPRR
jgi:hypothetical protein